MLIETFCWYLWWFVALIDDWFIPIGCLDIEIECTAGSVAISWGTVEQYITVPCSTIQSSQLIHAHMSPRSGHIRPLLASPCVVNSDIMAVHARDTWRISNCYIDSCCHQSAHWWWSYVVVPFPKLVTLDVAFLHRSAPGLTGPAAWSTKTIQNVYNVRCPIPLPMVHPPWIHCLSESIQNPLSIESIVFECIRSLWSGAIAAATAIAVASLRLFAGSRHQRHGCLCAGQHY